MDCDETGTGVGGGYEKRCMLRLRGLEWNWAVEAEVCYISSRLKYDCHEQAMIPPQTKLQGSKILAYFFLFTFSLYSCYMRYRLFFGF